MNCLNPVDLGHKAEYPLCGRHESYKKASAEVCSLRSSFGNLYLIDNDSLTAAYSP